MRLAALVCVVSVFAYASSAQQPAADPAIVNSQFVYESAPFPSCHASTIEQTPTGIVAAWFGGSDEGNNDVGIWFARLDDKTGKWSAPVEVATGVTPEQNNRRFPCWNPVLFQPPARDGKPSPLMLFYKVGPSPEKWWGMLITSPDGGGTWSPPRRLPDGILGPIKNKPVLLSDGTLLCGSSTEHAGWRVHMELSPDLGQTWTKTAPLNDGIKLGAIQPGILANTPAGSETLRILCRTRGGGKVAQSTSSDNGRSWTALELVSLPNPNSGLDAVSLKDGRGLLVYNHVPTGRTPLNVAISIDGTTWETAVTLESARGEYSYPAVIQAADGKVHITYTWKRKKIRHVVIDPARLKPSVGPKAE